MNIQNIASLTQMLSTIGFDDIGYRLLQHICFKPEEFTLTERLIKGNDMLTCSIYFERKNDAYTCSYYEASFLKEMEMPDLVVQTINIKELDKRMTETDWEIRDEKAGSFNPGDESVWQREKQIEKIVTDLSRLSITEEGKHFADCLKVKHWSGIPPHSSIGNLNALKSRFEVSQRFYFFDGQNISIDEAYRFLLNRWLEKRMHAKKKGGSNEVTEDTEAGNGETTGDKSLLQKKRRSKTNKIKR